MAIVTDAHTRSGLRSFSASLDLETPADDAFALLCSVEKWPVWLSFLRSASLIDAAVPLGLGSEVIVRSTLPGDEEQLYEVDQYISNFHLSLVGAYSVRRRLDFRIEHKSSRARLHVRLTYPEYHGRLGAMVHNWKWGRKIERALDDALAHFKGLAEFRTDDGLLADL